MIDALWLSLTMSRVYQKYLSHVLAEKASIGPVVVFYLLYAFGLYFLVVRPLAANNTSFVMIFVNGMILGLTAYGTYDLTNQATIKNWPVFITLIDLVWGSILSGVLAIIGVWVLRKF